MENVTAMNIVRDTLSLNLSDPRVVAGGTARASWIFADEPITSDKYPIIELNKLKSDSNIISMGDTDYCDHTLLYITVWFSSKNGFKVTIDGTEYKNSQLVEYYLGKIGETLKSKFNVLFNQGVGGYRQLSSEKVAYDHNTQLYYGAVQIRVWYFKF